MPGCVLSAFCTVTVTRRTNGQNLGTFKSNALVRKVVSLFRVQSVKEATC